MNVCPIFVFANASVFIIHPDAIFEAPYTAYNERTG